MKKFSLGAELTFNTTSLPLRRALEKKLLPVRRPVAMPSFEGDGRHVLVDPYIDALLDGCTQFGLFPTVETESLITRFSAGWLISVSRRKRAEKDKARPDVEQIVGVNEVWALCPRKPKPGWRILGRFYDRGTFVALTAWDKHKLAGRYEQAAIDVVDLWNDLFPGKPLHKATDVDGYVGGVFRDVDQNA